MQQTLFKNNKNHWGGMAEQHLVYPQHAETVPPRDVSPLCSPCVSQTNLTGELGFILLLLHEELSCILELSWGTAELAHAEAEDEGTLGELHPWNVWEHWVVHWCSWDMCAY